MAVVQNPLIGRSRQKLAGTVFRTWKRLNVLQAKPIRVTNPNSDAQKFARGKLAFLVRRFRSALSFIRLSFGQFQDATTQWATFLGINIKNAFTGAPPIPLFVPANMVVSSGTLINADVTALSNPSGRTVRIDWTDNSGMPGANSSDRCVLAFIHSSGENYFLTTGATRDMSSMQVSVPGTTPLSQFHIFFYFDNSVLRNSSPSEHLGTV